MYVCPSFTSVHLFHLNKSGQQKQWVHTTPVPGGKFGLDKRFDLLGWKVFRVFVLAKLTCAVVLNKIVVDVGFPLGCSTAISPDAVGKELGILEETRCELRKLRKTGVPDGLDAETLFCQHCGAKMMFSLVQHAVGVHKDVFLDGVSSLENCMCFSIKTGKDGNTGRGTGLGMEKFVFAVLDW